MDEFATSIHSPTSGKKMAISGRIVIDRDMNYSPRPSIFVEFPCSRIRFTVYLEKILINPKGTSAGIPVQKNAVINTIRYMLAASL